MCWTHYWKGCLDFEYCRGSLFKQAKKCAWFDCYLSAIASTNKLQKGNFSQLVDWMFRYIFQSLAFQESNVLFAQMKIFDLRYIFSLHNLVGTLQSFCIEKEPYMFEKNLQRDLMEPICHWLEKFSLKIANQKMYLLFNSTIFDRDWPCNIGIECA